MLGPIDLHAIMKHSYRNTFNFKKTSLKDEIGHTIQKGTQFLIRLQLFSSILKYLNLNKPELEEILFLYYSSASQILVKSGSSNHIYHILNCSYGWDVKIYIQEYIFLYVAHFCTNKLPFFRFRRLYNGEMNITDLCIFVI